MNMETIISNDGSVKVVNRDAKNFKIGDTVHWMDSWGNYQFGTISGFVEGKDAVSIYGEGKKGISTGALLEKCWETKEALFRAEARRAKEQTRVYAESITTVKELVQFLFDHQVNGEYKDYDAEAAARKRAKEFGLNIEER